MQKNDRQKTIAELKRKIRKDEIEKRLLKVCPNLEYRFLNLEDTIELERVLWDKINRTDIQRSFPTNKHEAIQHLNKIKEEWILWEELLLIHEESSEVGALILNAKNAWENINEILDFISYEKRESILTGGLILVSRDLESGVCILHEEYDDSLITWGIN